MSKVKLIFIVICLIFSIIIGTYRAVEGKTSDFNNIYKACNCLNENKLLNECSPYYRYPPTFAYIISPACNHLTSRQLAFLVLLFSSVMLIIPLFTFEDFNLALNSVILLLPPILDSIMVDQINIIPFFSLPVLAYYFRKSSLLSGFFLSLAIVLKAIPIILVYWLILEKKLKNLFFCIIFCALIIILIGKNFYIWIDDSFFHFIKYAQLNPKYHFGFGEKNYSIFSVLDYFHISKFGFFILLIILILLPFLKLSEFEIFSVLIILMLIFSPIYYLLRTKAKIYLFLPLLYIPIFKFPLIFNFVLLLFFLFKPFNFKSFKISKL